MRRTVIWAVLLVAIATDATAQTGLTYRFRADTLTGTAWVLDAHARRELESGEGGTAAGRIEIWKDGGKQIFILDPANRTYYEDNAYRQKQGLDRATAPPLTAGRPFRVVAVDGLQLDLKRLQLSEIISGYLCRRAILTFAYTLTLALEQDGTSMPARIEGTQDFCLMDAPAAARLPFDHGIEFRSGHRKIDDAVAARVSALQGIPVARMLKVTRRIDTGEPVSTTSALLLSDLREVEIAPDRFEVPKDYRFREPQIVSPARKDR